MNSVDRVASVSLDKKDGVKFNLEKDKLSLSVNNASSGDGKETLSTEFINKSKSTSSFFLLFFGITWI